MPDRILVRDVYKRQFSDGFAAWVGRLRAASEAAAALNA